MIKVGEPFKMLPLTRKASNALSRTALAVGVSEEDVSWGLWGDPTKDGSRILVVARGDRHLVSMRWVETKNDPDWKIV